MVPPRADKPTFEDHRLPCGTRRPTRILIAEDDLPLRELLVEYTSVLGYAPTPVADGGEALIAAAAQPPDLLICDVGLPGLSGLEVCRRFKTGTGTACIPVLLITGMGEDNVSSVDNVGADGILWKPFGLEDLRIEIERLLRNSGDYVGLDTRSTA